MNQPFFDLCSRVSDWLIPCAMACLVLVWAVEAYRAWRQERYGEALFNAVGVVVAAIGTVLLTAGMDSVPHPPKNPEIRMLGKP